MGVEGGEIGEGCCGWKGRGRFGKVDLEHAPCPM